MTPNEELLTQFYTAFQKKDWNTMVKCYHENVEFQDAVFTLQGWKAKAMWRMLCERASADFQLTFTSIQADDSKGKAHWEPVYQFSKTGRKVHNIIDASFEFKDGKIIKHVDSFSLWRWSRMALGMPGIFLGWTPKIQNKIKSEAVSGLDLFIKRNRLNETSFSG